MTDKNESKEVKYEDFIFKYIQPEKFINKNSRTPIIIVPNK